jgi:methionyl-tRNA formyltransferase
MGSPAFAVPALEALARATEVVAVVTQPDRPAGRGLELVEPAVKVAARAAGLPILQPASVRKPPFVEELRALAPDLAVVVAYGRILPPEVLATPRLGCWNVHASLLPRLRGAAPIQWVLIRGERRTGVTLMQMDAGLDTGAILLQRELDVDLNDEADITSGELHERLSRLGATTLAEGLELEAEGRLAARPQDDTLATLAPLLTKETGRIDFSAGAVAVQNLVRGCDPWPGAYFTHEGVPIKVFGARVVSGRGEPGLVMGADRDGLLVGCGTDAVAFAALQRPGRKRLDAAAFLAGMPIERGALIGGGG